MRRAEFYADFGLAPKTSVTARLDGLRVVVEDWELTCVGVAVAWEPPGSRSLLIKPGDHAWGLMRQRGAPSSIVLGQAYAFYSGHGRGLIRALPVLFVELDRRKRVAEGLARLGKAMMVWAEAMMVWAEALLQRQQVIAARRVALRARLARARQRQRQRLREFRGFR